MRKRKLKPMSIKKINMMMSDFNSDYRLKKVDNEIIMVKKGDNDDWKIFNNQY